MEVVKISRHKKAIVTLVTNDYLHQAILLGDSLKKFEKEADFLVFVVGYDASNPDYQQCDFQLIDARILNAEEWQRFVFHYNGLAACCALKPLALKYALGFYEKVIHLDNDMELFHGLEEGWKELDDADVSLVPHKNRAPQIFKPLIDPLLLRLSGIFNTGYVGVSSSASYFLEWWWGKTHYNCLIDEHLIGIYLDQLYLNEAVGLIDRLSIVKHDGYNVGWWNLDQKNITRDHDRYLVNGVPLVFFHFSCLEEILKKLQGPNWLEEDIKNIYLNLYTTYQYKLAVFKKKLMPQEYVYQNFNDGTYIPDCWRELVRRDLSEFKDISDPFSLTQQQRSAIEAKVATYPENFQPNKEREISDWKNSFLAHTHALRRTTSYIQALERQCAVAQRS